MATETVKTVTPVLQTQSEIKKDSETLIVTSESVVMLSKAFGIQDDFENESKFAQAFVHDAILSHIKASISATISRWERCIDKYSASHPQLTREQCENELLSSKKMRDLNKLAKLATQAKASL